MYLPQKYLHKALISKLKTLGYSVSGLNTFPRVEVYNFDTTPTGEKVNKQWTVTFLFDCISAKTDPSESYTMLETIRNGFSESLTVDHFNIYLWIWDQHTDFMETSENDDIIFRQLQRVRLELTEK